MAQLEFAPYSTERERDLRRRNRRGKITGEAGGEGGGRAI